jgi:hypothetical protein
MEKEILHQMLVYNKRKLENQLVLKELLNFRVEENN